MLGINAMDEGTVTKLISDGCTILIIMVLGYN